MGEPSQAVRDLVAERQAARQERDFARADALREQLRAAGWLVRDTPAGPELAEVPPYEAVDPAALRPRWDEPDRHEVTVVVHVAGWPQDVARAVTALAAHCGGVDHEVVLVDDGAGEETGRALEDLARAVERVRVLHLSPALGFGAAMNLAMGQALGRVLVWLDPHVEATGDLLAPLLEALTAPDAGLAGGWGVVTTSMLEFEADQGPEVDAVEGYLLAVPRALAARVAVDARDRYYRNADLDYSFAVRDLGYSIHRGTRRGSSGPLRSSDRGTPSGFPGPLRASDRGTPSGGLRGAEPPAVAGFPGPLRAYRVDVPARRHRHRAFHETDPSERDRASRKNYDRFLARWKSRTDLLTHGFRGYHRHR